MIFKKDNVKEIKDQIEAILTASEQRSALESSVTYAHMCAVFYLELLSSGIEKEEAVQMTTAMMYATKS